VKACRRIAHILHYHSPVGGAEKATLFLARHLRERGWDSVAYCLPSADESLRTFFQDQGIQVSTHQQVPHSLYRTSYLRASWALARDFRRHDISLIHCADLPSVFPVLYAAKICRLPVLCHIRALYGDICRRDKFFLSLVDRFAFVSQAAADQFAFRRAARHGAVVYDGIDICPLPRAESRARLLQEFGFSQQDKLVGMVARVGHCKDHRTFIEAASLLRLQYPNLRFLIVGDYREPYHQEYYRRACGWVVEYGVGDRLLFTGHRTDVAQILAGLDVSVLCTQSEALGLALLEAMAQKTPVIGTAVGGVLEIIRHGETGLLHAENDARAVADEIRFYIEHPDQAAAMAERAYEDVRGRFGPDAYLDRMERLYCSLTTG
jgi:glycosyltransferase involved in cell wall biosynthesis